ncbi:hypothetical protein P280DRAFT_521352 [Massarina eburnea CBS 473.64]|uniref:Ubiquitin-like protease family profile domain-containing protein n=1 Tax=Massarina eburnea CBS 473.64 TaxID=1395130 RepID=A0A6A6RPS1_9PLEO|nr:hypothetical protein P280DRAFT_521352 [Massarina eburnea CBS 473.64]
MAISTTPPPEPHSGLNTAVSYLPLMRGRGRTMIPRARRYSVHNTYNIDIINLTPDQLDRLEAASTEYELLGKTTSDNHVSIWKQAADRDVTEHGAMTGFDFSPDYFSPVEYPALNPSANPELRPYPPPLNHLAIELEKSNLSYESFQTIDKVGREGWFSDEVLTTSFEFLSIAYPSATYKIVLSNVWDAQRLFLIGDTALDVEWKEYKDLEGWQDMQYFILPISDTFVIQEDPETSLSGETEGGLHWSLIVADARAPEIKVRHFDSLGAFNQGVATRAMKGLCRLLRHLRPDFYTDDDDIGHGGNAPSQRTHNLCKEDATSACGPMTWAMAKEFVQYIGECADNGRSTPRDFLTLPQGYAEMWGMTYDSRDTRNMIKALVVRERRLRLWRWGTTDFHEMHRKIAASDGEWWKHQEL